MDRRFLVERVFSGTLFALRGICPPKAQVYTNINRPSTPKDLLKKVYYC